jgi:hypothetical protein
MIDRFEAPFQAVMVRHLLMHEGKKQPREVVVKVGLPYDADDGWRCPVSVPWYASHPVHIAGIDAIHSMQLALEFIEHMLEGNGGRRFFYSDGEPYVGYKAAVLQGK